MQPSKKKVFKSLIKYDSIHIDVNKYAKLVGGGHTCVWLPARACLRPVLIRSMFPGFLRRDRRLFSVRKMEKHVWIKSLGWMDGKANIQIEMGLNNIRDNYLYKVDFSTAQNSSSTYLH